MLWRDYLRPEIALVALPFGAAFIVSMILGPGIISMLKSRRIGQRISEDGPESHATKAGTPTMGGLIIIAGMLVGTLATAWILLKPSMGLPGSAIEGENLLAVVVLMVGLSLLGLLDDYLTIHPRGGVRGIASKPKAAAQFFLILAFIMWLAGRPEAFNPALYIGGREIISGWLYWVFAVVYITGFANFVNITDGLDGLVAGLTAILCVTLVMVGFFTVARAEGGVLLAGLVSAMMGACVAFLWYNANPAKVFMGDTGSLALGVGLPAIAIITHRELFLVIAGFVFIMDGFSTMIQWAVFKYTRIRTGTGRRVFKKSPVHHHFELSGWAEPTVVTRFWIIGVVAGLIALAGAIWGIW